MVDLNARAERAVLRKSLAQERDKMEILRRLRNLRPDCRRRWGRMSAHQMVCHLEDSFRVLLGRLPVSSAVTPLSRTVIKWAAFHLPWPPGIRTRPELDQVRGGGTKPVGFARDLNELEVLLEEVTAPGVDFGSTEHPLFGPMCHAECLRWGYLHMDHHLRQFGV